MQSIIFQTINGLLDKTNVFKNKTVRNFFWNLRAADINKKWGDGTGDYNALKKIIDKTSATTILDFGCGSGRLFPLFNSLKIKEVVGQDISFKAISLAQKKYAAYNYSLLCCDVEELDYAAKHFDLIISNRSLSAIHPIEISKVIDKICNLGKCIYLNELSKLTLEGESSYWFKHDYELHLSRNGFKLTDSGVIDGSVEEWFLFESIT